MNDYLKKLFIDEAKAVLFKGGIEVGGGGSSGSGDGSGDISDDEIATDEEVEDVIDDVFG